MTTYYKRVDRLTRDEKRKLEVDPNKVWYDDVMAISTGEKRKPKKGEWFLSGAIIDCWQTTTNQPQESRHDHHASTE